MNKSILIIGTQRSGTNSLARGLYPEIGLLEREPWNYNSPLVRTADYSNDWKVSPFNLSKINSEDPIVVKTQSFQKPISYPKSPVDFNITLSERFDKNRIILLLRKDFNKHLTSYTNLRYKAYLHGYWTGLAEIPWNQKDIPQSYLDNREEQKSIYDDLKKQRDMLFEIAGRLDIKITWYEDLFGDDRKLSLKLIKAWNLGIDETTLNDKLHPKYKYDKTHIRTLI